VFLSVQPPCNDLQPDKYGGLQPHKDRTQYCPWFRWLYTFTCPSCVPGMLLGLLSCRDNPRQSWNVSSEVSICLVSEKLMALKEPMFKTCNGRINSHLFFPFCCKDLSKLPAEYQWQLRSPFSCIVDNSHLCKHLHPDKSTLRYCRSSQQKFQGFYTNMLSTLLCRLIKEFHSPICRHHFADWTSVLKGKKRISTSQHKTAWSWRTTQEVFLELCPTID